MAQSSPLAPIYLRSAWKSEMRNFGLNGPAEQVAYELVAVRAGDRSCKLCAVQRVFDWFSRLNLAQKVLAVPFAALVLFSLANLLTAGVISLMGPGDQAEPLVVEQDAAPPAATSPSASAEATSPEVPYFEMSITGARWEGEKAVVEGTWEGKISSVHCDLFEGGKQGRRVTDWWDRGVPSKTSLSGRTFAQEFVEAKGRKIENPLDPAVRYSTICQAEAEGGAAFDDAWVEGSPPG
jgi:hypothetical protein